MAERYEITVDANGVVKGDVIGGKGKSCDRFKAIAKAIGDPDVTYLPEYEQEAEIVVEQSQQQTQTL